MNITLFGHDSPFSIAFTIGNTPIYWYAIFSILGYFSAICIYMIVIAKRYRISYDVGLYYVFFALPMIIIGARLWSYMIGDAKNISQFFNLREGGLAVQGGVVFGVLTALIYFPIILSRPKFHVRVYEDGNVYIQKPSMWLYADAIVPTILIGQAIGRWGNFFNGEIFGAVVENGGLDWLKLMMPGVYSHMTPTTSVVVGGITYNSGTYFQPLFLYESFLNVISFTIIYGVLAELHEFKAGTIASLYFVDYGIIRFITESLRSATFRFAATYILNAVLLIGGIIVFICCQWIFPRYRNYRNYHFLWAFTVWVFNQQTQSRPHLNDREFIRVEGGGVYFANR